MFLPDRYVKGECPVCHTADQYGDSCENCGSTYTPDKLINPVSTISGTPPVLRESEHYFFKLGDFTDVLRAVVRGRRRAPARSARQTRRVVRSGPAGLGHLARRALLRLRDSRCAREIFLRVVRCPHRLSRQLQGVVRQARAELRRISARRQQDRAVSLHRQGHQLLPQPVLAGGAARLGLPQADRGVRARLSHHQRHQDVEVARHVHHRAQLPRTSAAGAAALLLRQQARSRASTTSTCRWKTSSRA